jgi:hypothetical protein
MSNRLELVQITDPGHVLRLNVDIIVYAVDPPCVECVYRSGDTVAEVMKSKDVQGVYCLPSRVPKPKPRTWRVRDYMYRNVDGEWFHAVGTLKPPSETWDEVVPVSDWYTVTEVTEIAQRKGVSAHG